MRINRRKTPPATISPVPSFFKIIFPSNLISHNLRIPKDFAKLYRTEWSSSVKLTVPNGETWDVGLHKEGNSIWFSDGWKEFSEHYSIGCWFLLTFDYVGTSVFNVHIYNITCTEITYPRNKRNLTSDSVKEAQCSSKKRVPYERFNPETSGKGCYFTRSKRRKFEDEGRKIKFESKKVLRKPKVGVCEMPGQNKCDDERRNVENLDTEANDGRPHQLKFSGQMELATQNEDDEQETVKGETEVDSAISPWEDKSRNKGVIFSSENPAFTVILEPYYAKYLFGNLPAHIIIEAKYQSCWTVYLPLKFSINYLNFTSKALVPLASSVNQWEVVPARDQHQINIRQFDVPECNLASTEYPTASLLDISESEGNKSVELSDLAPEFYQRIKQYATKRLKSDNCYFTRSKRQRLDDKRKPSAEGMVRVNEMPNSRRSSLIDTPDHKERKQDKNLVNSQSAKDGPNPTEDAHHMDSVARNEGYEQPTIRNEEMESPIPKMMTRKSSKALGRDKTNSQVMMTENPAYTVIMEPRQVRYYFLMQCKPLEFSINYLHFTSKAMVPLASCGNQREVVLEKHIPQVNIQQFKVPECRCDHSVAQKLSELAPEFSQRINTYAAHFCSTKRLRSDNHYFTRSKRQRSDDDRKATAVGNVRVHDKHNSRRTSIIDIPDQNKSKQPKNLENSHSGKDGSNPTEGSHRMDSEAQNEGYEQLTIRKEDVELSVPKMMTRHMAISKVMMFKTENLTFTVIMKPSQVRHCFSVYIPVGFSRKHLGMVTSRTRIHLTYGGKKWEVILVINAKYYYLSGGWVTFVKDNGLMVGDVCVFELVEVRNVVFKVSIFRANEGGQKTSPQK